MKLIPLITLVLALASNLLSAADYSSKNGTIELSQSSFDAAVIQSKKPVIVVFSATWCQPCQLLKPVVNEVAKKLGDNYLFVKMDFDENRDIATRYSVKVLPTILYFKNGQLTSTSTGKMSQGELESKVKSM